MVLAMGTGYFHDGRVGPERYASDLAPTMVGSVTAAHLLLRGLFEELGSGPGSRIAVRCGPLVLRFGAEPGQVQVARRVSAGAAGRPGTPEPDTASAPKKSTDAWVRGVVASRDSDHAQAAVAFEAEATAALTAGAPQRAAIAFRSAAAAARAAGRADNANRLLRLAGKAYLEIAEKSETIPQGVFMAFRESARCFLEAGNLPLAHTCLTKAIAIGETLGYTE